MSDPATHRTKSTMPAILGGLGVLLLLMAVTSFVGAVRRQGGFPGATALVTLLLGIAVAAALGVVAWRLPRTQVDETGVQVRTPGTVRTLRWDEITRVTTERAGGKSVMRLYRDAESWELDFLSFPKPEQVVGFVTARLPRTVKPTAAAPAE